jgi:penicillin-binding protein 1A
MLRALWINLRSGRRSQGGSTITQQVVKNVLLDSTRSYRRKIRETILARELEQHLSKDEILALYMNHIYLGHGRHGIEEASRYYFGKKAKALDLAEAASLAGLVASPARFSPRNHPERALERRSFVLHQMRAKGFITTEMQNLLSEVPLHLAPPIETESELAPEAVSFAKRTLTAVVGKRAAQGGYEIETTIDPALQAAARKTVRENLAAYAKRHRLEAPFVAEKNSLWGRPFEGTPVQGKIYVGVVEETHDEGGSIDVRIGNSVGRVFLSREPRYNPDGLVPSKFTKPGALLRVRLLSGPGDDHPLLRLELGPQSALVAIDVRSREVLALVGSYEALAGGLDRATQSRRQPGSAFKAFVYSYALHSRRFTPATVLEVPGGHRKNDLTKMSVRTALAKSNNAAAVEIFRDAGPANIVHWAQALGIESKLETNESLALGAYEVTPLEITNAYAAFPNGGTHSTPKLVRSITEGARGPVEMPPAPPPRRVLTPEEAYLTTSLLASVVEEGTGRRARSLNRPVAGKTGTTNDARDAWFIGYSTDLVAGVWVGFDDALALGPGESGSATALPAWVDFMKVAHVGKPVTDFARPGSIVVASVDPNTGLLAPPTEEDAVREEFLDGTAPTEMTPRDSGMDGGIARPTDSGASRPRSDADPRFPLPVLEPPPF